MSLPKIANSAINDIFMHYAINCNLKKNKTGSTGGCYFFYGFRGPLRA